MIETLTALLFAHICADFLLQTPRLVARKREAPVILLHTGIVLVTAMLATGRADAWQILVLAAVHMIIDLIKTHMTDDGLGAFLADQIAHLATIVGIALLAPTLWATGIWATSLPAPLPAWGLHAMALVTGVVLVTRVGGFVVGKLMIRFPADFTENGLPAGGQYIGFLERLLIFLLISIGQPQAIGFLIAAKSVMRFETASKEQPAAEYVIIGTLASFAWAIAVTIAVIALRDALPALEITSPQP